MTINSNGKAKIISHVLQGIQIDEWEVPTPVKAIALRPCFMLYPDWYVLCEDVTKYYTACPRKYFSLSDWLFLLYIEIQAKIKEPLHRRLTY